MGADSLSAFMVRHDLRGHTSEKQRQKIIVVFHLRLRRICLSIGVKQSGKKIRHGTAIILISNEKSRIRRNGGQ